MHGSSRRGRSSFDIWPGFVDVLATILLVFVFVLLFFVVAQFYLSDTLRDRDRSLEALESEVAQLAETLSMERRERRQLEGRVRDLDQALAASLLREETLQTELAVSETTRERLAAALEEEQTALEARETELAERGERLAVVEQRLRETESALATEEALSAEARARVAALQDDIRALREQLTALSQALDIAEATATVQRAEIAELGERLNLALARRVEELDRYRSEFFGRLREALADVEEIEIVGDRFRFQSELFFESASADIGPAGRETLDRLAETFERISERIPEEIDWVLQVEGHTDRRPIRTEAFPSNWELSTTRALNIVHYLSRQGLPEHRLAAAGFGEHQPVDERNTPEAWARNRRIELRLTNR
ncbi:peptidoglycan -binding protein [Natronospira bacteriovora]|uniref:Peptidoglycan -binding protein n=1 Tax=Natronospira bacteriovora TaxID=3069753 RepID=A0ABU0W7W2_9GAMM|nr:peptidoglycan -binding protein [Natronospira sp. AB-CW4]MDQ2070037.1 peptidoglycan -binding protein [Natronospira sp. AB-CW4]